MAAIVEQVQADLKAAKDQKDNNLVRGLALLNGSFIITACLKGKLSSLDLTDDEAIERLQRLLKSKNPRMALAIKCIPKYLQKDNNANVHEAHPRTSGCETS